MGIAAENGEGHRVAVRGYEDHLALDAVLNHVIADMLGYAERTVQVHVDHANELLFGHIVNVRIAPYTGGINKDIQRTESLRSKSHNRLHALFVRHVALAELHSVLTEPRLGKKRHRSSRFLLREAGHDYIRAALQKAKGCAEAEAGGAARHKGRFAGDMNEVFQRSRFRDIPLHHHLRYYLGIIVVHKLFLSDRIKLTQLSLRKETSCRRSLHHVRGAIHGRPP